MKTGNQKRLRLDASNSTPGTERQINGREKALQIPLIVDKIVNSMDLPQLKISRQINQYWRFVSSKVIKKRYPCTIFLRHDADNSSQSRVETLGKILSQSENFPCSSIDFTIFKWQRMSREVDSFFDHHGSKVKTLTLICTLRDKVTSVMDMTQNGVIGQILSKLAPTLENLNLYPLFQLNWPSGLEFPRLKSIMCLDSSNMLQILKMAPNLEIISTMFLGKENLNVIAQFGRLDLIKEATSSELIQNLSDFGGLKLWKMALEDSRMKMDKILESSKNSLKHLILTEEFCPGFLFPKLANLKTLEIAWRRRRVSIDPLEEEDPPVIRRISLDETFPHLQVLDLTHVSQSQNEDLTFIFSPDFYSGNLPTVKKLKMGKIWTQSWVSHLLHLCPNFSQLEINCKNGPPDLARVFKLWPQLTELKLNHLHISHQFDIDSHMTGMSESTCERVRSLNSEEKEKNWQDLVIGPSLRDLKGLKRLIIKLENDSLLPFSRLSLIYSFKMMPKLKVSLIIAKHLENGMQTLMNELGSHVNIE